MTRCERPRAAAKGGLVRLVGGGLGDTASVEFSSAGGTVSRAPTTLHDRSVEVRVPAGARSGRPRAVDSHGGTATSAESLQIVPSRRVPPPRSFRLRKSSVGPNPGFVEFVHPVLLRFRFRSDRSIDLRVAVVRAGTGSVVTKWRMRDATPFHLHHVRWNGLGRGGRPVADGHYRFRVGRRGGRLRLTDRFAVHGHYFPVRGTHWDRGPIGQFGAPRTGGRTHEGYDVMSPCGTRLDAVRAGRVERRGFDPRLYGNYVQIDARGEDRDYFYAHMRAPATVGLGDRVRTGEHVGNVGKTGDAQSVGCHLHFEIHVRGTPIDPKPDLTRWDRWS